MISDLARLVDTVHREKNIPRDILIEVLESAMIAAGRKRFGLERDLEAQFNEDLGEVELFVEVDNFFWGLWAVVQAGAEGCDDFPYLTYAHNRLNRAFEATKA